MGTFEGHAIPSFIYTFIGLWWSFVTAVKYISAEKYKTSKFKGSTIMPCFFCPTKKLRTYPIESIFKLVFLTVHTIVEMYSVETGFLYRGEKFNPMPAETIHHIAMLSGFIFGSIIEILIYYGVPFPKKTEYMCSLIAFFIQAVLMLGHLHGAMDVEQHMHYLWSILIGLTLFAGLLETYDPDCFWFVYSRIFFFICQGTWLMQTAFVVWPQTKNPAYHWTTDHRDTTWLTVSLMYHMICVAAFMLLQYLFVYAFHGLFYRFYKKYELDLEDNDQKIVFKSSPGTEYSMLMNEEDD